MGDEHPATEPSATGRARRADRSVGIAPVALALAVLAGLLQSVNLLYVARAGECDRPSLVCPVELDLWEAPDSGSYLAVASEIERAGLTGASFRERTPGYPLAILATRALTGGRTAPVLWLGAVLAACATAAAVVATFLLTGSERAGAAAGVLACLWPANYQFVTHLLTDAPHGFLAGIALASTIAWTVRPTGARLALALVSWIATQLVRPVFFPIGALWPLLVLSLEAPRRKRLVHGSIGMAALVIVPALIVASNAVHHGIAAPSVGLPRTIAEYAVPRLQSELGLGEFEELRTAATERYAALELADRVAAQRADARRFFRAHPWATAKSFVLEMRLQLLTPPRFYHAQVRKDLYPSALGIGVDGMRVVWLLAAVGLVGLGIERPALAVFLAGVTLLVLVPAATSHLVEGRLRFPIDVMAIPVTVSGLTAGWRRLRSGRTRRSPSPR